MKVYKKKSKKSGKALKKAARKVARSVARLATVNAMRKVARQEIHRMTEDHEFQTQPVNVAIGGGPVQFTAAAWEANCCIDVNDLLLDNINQGTNTAQRVGNRIRLRSCVWKAVFSPYREASTGQYNNIPAELKITVLSSLVNPNSADKTAIRTICSNSLYQANASAIGMTSQLIDFLRIYNRDQVRVYKTRRYKIGNQNNVGNVAGVTTVLANNDFKLNQFCTINLTKYMNKIIKYDDSPSDARNKKIFIILEAVPADQTAGTTTPLVTMTNYLRCKWEDM